VAEIYRVGAKPAPRGAVVRQLSGTFVIPGLIDAHVHATSPFERAGQQDTILSFMFRGGVTTVRDMAGDAIKLQALTRSADSAAKAWPRIVYSAVFAGPEFFRSDRRVPSIAHGMAIGDAPWMRPVTPGMDFVRDVGLAKSTGARGIKVYTELEFTDLARLTAEAHRQGLRVWSHAALMPARPSEVVRAGVDVLSHVYLLVMEGNDSLPRLHRESLPAHRYEKVAPDSPAIDSVLRMMKERGTMLEPTLYVNGGVAARALTDTGYRYFANMDTWSFEVTRRARRLGVPIVVGTDLMARPSRDSLPLLHDEMELLVRQAGLSPLEAIIAATRTNARALGIHGDYGVVRPGLVADLVVLGADPTADIRNTRSILFTVKGGVVHAR
jgi:imidazolonepropionase-like amidohydrolase